MLLKLLKHKSNRMFITKENITEFNDSNFYQNGRKIDIR